MFCYDNRGVFMPLLIIMLLLMKHFAFILLAVIWYHLIFLRLSKVWSMLYHASVGGVQNKNSTLYFHLLVWLFFHHKICVHDFFLWSIKFPQQNINQSETWIGGLWLLLKLHVEFPSRRKHISIKCGFVIYTRHLDIVYYSPHYN